MKVFVNPVHLYYKEDRGKDESNEVPVAEGSQEDAHSDIEVDYMIAYG